MSGAGSKGAHGGVSGGRDEHHVARHFVICKEIMLGFFNGREQYDVLIDPGQGTLMFDGSDIYWLIDNEQRMSDTINHAIGIWLRDGSIEEVMAPPSPSTAAGSDEPPGRKHEE
ncbi:hypothetical protein [Pelomonas sp. Root1444]|uniref:hypothetical protein n=1 Tax=Pelomonas sp. Root1444 TaxID=1736464 RepID=UPI0007035C29|nr:hypothetical protein [Pelomonas sp. Root1444]KQY80930.1 hypothetical protein ASD35_03530 [Pelomonas sp. Root1444]